MIWYIPCGLFGRLFPAILFCHMVIIFQSCWKCIVFCLITMCNDSLCSVTVLSLHFSATKTSFLGDFFSISMTYPTMGPFKLDVEVWRLKVIDHLRIAGKIEEVRILEDPGIVEHSDMIPAISEILEITLDHPDPLQLVEYGGSRFASCVKLLRIINAEINDESALFDHDHLPFALHPDDFAEVVSDAVVGITMRPHEYILGMVPLFDIQIIIDHVSEAIQPDHLTMLGSRPLMNEVCDLDGTKIPLLLPSSSIAGPNGFPPRFAALWDEEGSAGITKDEALIMAHAGCEDEVPLT